MLSKESKNRINNCERAILHAIIVISEEYPKLTTLEANQALIRVLRAQNAELLIEEDKEDD